MQTWGGNVTSVDLLIYPEYANEVEELFKTTDIRYEINIRDLQRAIDLENPFDEEEEELANRQGKKMFQIINMNIVFDFLNNFYF